MTDAIQRLSSALSDRYRLERELGQGGMATVYLAHAFAPSPDGKRAAVMVTTATATLLGTVSLAEWEFRVIARWPFKAEGRADTANEGPGAVSGTSISWEANRSIYSTAWPRADEAPSLWRIDESGGAPTRVVNVPIVCELRSILLNLGSRLGACVSGDYRRDIWIMEGVGGR